MLRAKVVRNFINSNTTVISDQFDCVAIINLRIPVNKRITRYSGLARTPLSCQLGKRTPVQARQTAPMKGAKALLNIAMSFECLVHVSVELAHRRNSKISNWILIALGLWHSHRDSYWALWGFTTLVSTTEYLVSSHSDSTIKRSIDHDTGERRFRFAGTMTFSWRYDCNKIS